jgi:hypothetical protein
VRRSIRFPAVTATYGLRKEYGFMTLVVARSLETQLRIISDTKITDANAIKSGPLYGALKAVIISPNITVCFAGNVGRGQKAIEDVYKLTADSGLLERILAHLLDVHRAGQGDTDFVVASLGKSQGLNRIADDTIEQGLKTCWIGDFDAFAVYQESFHNVPEIGGDEVSNDYIIIGKMSLAFQNLIAQGKVATVDGPEIAVMSTRDGFKYAPKAIVFPPSQSIPSGQWATVIFGTAVEGGYGYSIWTPLRAGIGAVGVYFHPGDLGALFYPALQPAPFIYSGVSQQVFQKAVSTQFGFDVEGARFG